MIADRHDIRPRSVLLTGATGSLGGHLCMELLDTTTAVVHCLVRGTDREAAGRLSRHLAALGRGGSGSRQPIAVPADIERSDLGLPAARYDALAETVDTVIHCAANVNLVADYSRLAPCNLGGTEHLISFARRRAELTGRLPRFHFVSTLGVLAGARAAGLDDVDESTIPSDALAGPMAYAQTKAHAELRVRAAADRGLAITVHRPGLVTGHSRTARTIDTDLLVPFLRAAIAIQAIPTIVRPIPVEMVDVVARGIVALAGHAETIGRTFHHVRPRAVPVAEAFAALRRAGHPLDEVEPDQWWRRIHDCASHPDVQQAAALSSAADRYLIVADDGQGLPRAHAERTWTVLSSLGLDPPPLDEAFFDRFVAELGFTATSRIRPAPTAPPPASPDAGTQPSTTVGGPR